MQYCDCPTDLSIRLRALTDCAGRYELCGYGWALVVHDGSGTAVIENPQGPDHALHLGGQGGEYSIAGTARTC